MSYRFDFNRHAGRGYGIFSPRLNHDIRIGGGIIDQIQRTIKGIDHIASGEFRPGPDGGHHRSTGHPAGDHRNDDRNRDSRSRMDEPGRNGRDDEPRRNWRDDYARRDGAARGQGEAASADNSRSREREALAKNMGPEALNAVDRLLSLPQDQFATEFNKLPLEQKQEIISGYNKTYEGVTNTKIHLNANGNLDEARLRADTQASMQTTVNAMGQAGAAPPSSAAPATVSVDRAAALGQAIGIDGIRAQAAAETAAPAAREAPKPFTFDVKTLTTDVNLTTAELNRMSGAGISMTQAKLGQAPDAPKLMTDASGKIVGGYSVVTEGNAKSDATYRFSTREDLETKFGKEMVAGIEQGLKPDAGSSSVAASNKPAAEIPAADSSARNNIALNMTSNMNVLKA